jgi:raffinose/stachyose/melibiose transport system permease protein
MKQYEDSGIYIRSFVLKAVNYLLLILCCIVIIMPILILLNISFKTNQEYLYSSLMDPPKNILNFSNFINAVRKSNMLLGLKNTIILIVPSVVGNIVLGTMVAYAIGRFRFRGRKLLLGAFIAASVIPSTTTQVATFTVIKSMALYDTIFSAMVLYLGTGILQIYIFLQFIDNIPYELDESALLDGASYFRIYASIIIPEMKPAIATVGIIKILAIYNDMYIPYLYMPSINLKTVSTSLMAFSYDQNAQWNIMAAGIIVVMIPTLLLYLYLQKYIIAGIANGAVKG